MFTYHKWLLLMISGAAIALFFWLTAYVPTIPVQNLNPPQTQLAPNATTTDDWKTYRNDGYGFEFAYPADFQRRDGESTYFEGDRGGVGFFIKNTALDPSNIIDEQYGNEKIQDISTVPVGIKTGYQYLRGDGGCAAYVTEAALQETTTLAITMYWCEDGKAHPQKVILEDEKLRGQILATFKFL